jgi:hypothetical protein
MPHILVVADRPCEDSNPRLVNQMQKKKNRIESSRTSRTGTAVKIKLAHTTYAGLLALQSMSMYILHFSIYVSGHQQ